MISTPETILITLAAAAGLAALAFWVAMIRDCWISTEPGSRERRVWLLVVILGKLPGAAVYYLLRKRLVPVPGANGAD